MGFLMEDRCGSHLDGSPAGLCGPDWIHFARRSETLLTLAFRRNLTIQTCPDGFGTDPVVGAARISSNFKYFPEKHKKNCGQTALKVKPSKSYSNSSRRRGDEKQRS